MPSPLQRFFAFWRRAGWPEFLLLLGTLVFCLGVWVFLEMADDAVPGEYLPTEEKILRWFRHEDDLSHAIGPSWMPSVAILVTELGGTALLTALPVGAVAFLWWKRRRRSAGLMALAAVGGLVLIVGFKHAFARPRPSVVPHLVPVTSPSFPSGHSMMSAVVYLSMAVILVESARHRRTKILLIPAALFLSGIIGLSRMYLGVHYPTDVIAGWAAGTAWALLCWGTAHFLREHGDLKLPTAD